MEVMTVLERLLQLETAMRDLYGWMAGVFYDREDAVALFHRLRAQEEKHANLVRYQRRLVIQNPARFSDVDEDLGDLDHTLTRIQAFRGARERPPLADAVELAVELEATAAEAIHGALVARSNPELDSLMAALAGDDTVHLRLLQELRDRLDVPSPAA